MKISNKTLRNLCRKEGEGKAFKPWVLENKLEIAEKYINMLKDEDELEMTEKAEKLLS